MRLRSAGVVILFLLVTTGAMAASFIVPTDRELVHVAKGIVIATGVTSYSVPGPANMIYTVFELRVDDHAAWRERLDCVTDHTDLLDRERLVDEDARRAGHEPYARARGGARKRVRRPGRAEHRGGARRGGRGRVHDQRDQGRTSPSDPVAEPDRAPRRVRRDRRPGRAWGPRRPAGAGVSPAVP